MKRSLAPLIAITILSGPAFALTREQKEAISVLTTANLVAERCVEYDVDLRRTYDGVHADPQGDFSESDPEVMAFRQEGVRLFNAAFAKDPYRICNGIWAIDGPLSHRRQAKTGPNGVRKHTIFMQRKPVLRGSAIHER